MSGSFLAELKRRRVVRVLIVYLIAAWVVVQVSATVFPILELPEWTAKLVVMLAALGIPVVAFLGWAFDVTAGGVERTAPASPAVQRRVLGSGLVIVIGAIVLAGGIWFARGGAADEPELDVELVAALPFRVAGADGTLDYLEEGIVDLIAAKLTESPRAVDPRTVISAWRVASERAGAEPAESQGLEIARRLGAGRVLAGSIVGTASGITLSARLIDSASGTKVADATEEGARDSLTVLLDRLLSTLLSLDAGEPETRLAALTTTSLPALRAYLEGRRHYRAGRYRDAIVAYDRALTVDSTFALAGIGTIDAANMAAGWSDHLVRRGRELAFRHRSRLSRADLAYVEAHAAPTRSVLESIRKWERATRELPDRPEAWYNLGDQLFHAGPKADIDDHVERARNAFERALQLDSSYTAPGEHLMVIALLRGDSAEFSRLKARVRSGGGDWGAFDVWTEAAARRDTAALARLALSMDTLDPETLGMMTMSFGSEFEFGVDVSLRAVEIRLSHATSDEERRAALDLLWPLALNAGWSSRANPVLTDLVRAGAPVQWANRARMLAVLYWNADTAGVAAAAESLIAAPTDSLDHCVAAQWLAWQGSGRALILAEKLRTPPDSTQPILNEVCDALVHAVVAHRQDAPDAVARIERLDSLMSRGTRAGQMTGPANLTLTRLFAERGNPARALRASRRRDVLNYNMEDYRAPLLRQQAMLAARVGEREEAIQSYRRYLEIRATAEPGSRAHAEYLAARSELFALLAERRL